MEYNVKLNVDKVYICHYSKLIERKKHVIDQLNSNKIDNYEFVELYDKDNLDKNVLIVEYPNIFNKIKRENKYLNFAEISLLLKHCWCIKDAYNKNYKSIMILEDDIIFKKNFSKLIIY